MDNKIAFKLAHEMTKQVIKEGDNYQTTFGACLKHVKAQANKPKKPAINWLAAIETVAVYLVAFVMLGFISGLFGYIGILSSSVIVTGCAVSVACTAIYLIVQNVKADMEAGVFLKTN